MQTAAALTAFGSEIKDLVVSVTAGSSGLSAEDIKKSLPVPPAAPAASSSAGGVLPWLQLWATLASLYYADVAIKKVRGS